MSARTALVLGQRGEETSSMLCSRAHGTISSSSRVIEHRRVRDAGRRAYRLRDPAALLESFSRLAGVRFLPPAVMMMSFLPPVM
jgi:hypothetical protein